MILKQLSFHEYSQDEKYVWKIENVGFNNFTLIVGKNATGKTRLINILYRMAKQISGQFSKLLDGKWKTELIFRENEDEYNYVFAVDKNVVVEEFLYINKKPVLQRDKNSSKILDLEGKMRDFNPPEDKLTLHVRRDKKEYPYLEKLFYWAENYYTFRFSELRPANTIFAGEFVESKDIIESLATIPNIIQKMYMSDKEEGKKFTSTVVEDMKTIGYPLETFDIVNMGFPNRFLTITFKEDGLPVMVQNQMSSGMYRAFAMIVTINYLLMKDTTGTFAVDDIGEGLDFERSSGLVRLIQKKCENFDIQVILSSNERHLLNAVNVKYWNILERQFSTVVSYNYQNDKNAFDQFLMTGLSNFDLFADEMYKSEVLESSKKMKIAMFVEGETEHIFVRALLENYFAAGKIQIESIEMKGKRNTFIYFKDMRTYADHLCLIVNTRSDERVLSLIKENYLNMLDKGFEVFFGLRDLKSESFDIFGEEKVIETIHRTIKKFQISDNIFFHFAKMTIEAWLLASPKMFLELDSSLTVEEIESKVSINLEKIDPETIKNPTKVLKNILSLIDFKYSKKADSTHRIVSKIDWEDLCFEAQQKENISFFFAFLRDLESVIT